MWLGTRRRSVQEMCISSHARGHKTGAAGCKEVKHTVLCLLAGVRTQTHTHANMHTHKHTYTHKPHTHTHKYTNTLHHIAALASNRHTKKCRHELHAKVKRCALR